MLFSIVKAAKKCSKHLFTYETDIASDFIFDDPILMKMIYNCSLKVPYWINNRNKNNRNVIKVSNNYVDNYLKKQQPNSRYY